MSARAVFTRLAIVLLGLFFTDYSSAAVERYGLFVGSNRGQSDEADLAFAESDAERMQATMLEVGGFLPENTVLLRGATAASVQRALINLNDRVRAATDRPGTDVLLFVFYSGHANEQSLHLGQSELELSLLEQLVRSSAAEFRILVVDACRAGALTRVKGGRPAPGFDARVDEVLDGMGTVFLTSSSASEDAQESTELRGSFFTHYFRSGLLGPADTDGNGLVSVDEAYRYAYENTLRASSRSLAGLQHPTYRYELRGQGRTTLSTPGATSGGRGLVTFPEGGTFLIFLRDARGPVVAEVGAYDKKRSLSLASGKYFVVGRMPRYLLEGRISVEAGTQAGLDVESLKRADYARLARKGSSDSRVVSGLLAAYSFRTPLPNADTSCHGAMLGYAAAISHLDLSGRLGYCNSSFENPNVQARIDNWDLTVRSAYAWDLPWVTLELGANVGATLFDQHFETEGNAPRRTTFGALLGLDFGLSVDLGKGIYVFSESGAETHYFPIRQVDGSDALTTSIAFRQRAGLGKWF